MMAKKIFLSNPYGFTPSLSRTILVELVDALKSMDLEVYEPFERTLDVACDKKGWAYEIGKRDLADIRECDGVFAVINGTPPDEGVMVEIGYAMALGKPIFLFKDDFRKCCDCEEYPLNVMMFMGLPERNWKEFYYTSVDEIRNCNKELARWILFD